ncbi:serpin family protein [Nocardia sp. NPDC057668]|uniref:serpin family protein n=1 Tax=Nocardia sp. NPDC057668 TaxID=3346202 RepID=UPI00366F7A8D
MLTALSAHVHGSNRLTARWCAAAGTDDFAVSGCAVWPLLAVLAAAANEPARSELAGAVGIPAADAHAAALRMLRDLDSTETVSSAVGAWFRGDLPLHQDWLHSLPAGTAGPLPDQAALDTWAKERTHGAIDTFPLRIEPTTVMLLATTLLAETTWQQPFRPDGMLVTDGPWRGHNGPALRRTSTDTSVVGVLAGTNPVTRVIVNGTRDMDVHLLLSKGSPGDALAAGIAALEGSIRILSNPQPDQGPGLAVFERRSWSPGDMLDIWLPPFEIHATHDLIDHTGVFGLRTATNWDRGHFPGISPEPIHLSRAAQDVRVRFDARGFEAAAVSALEGALATGQPEVPPHRSRVTAAIFDRPFGFLAVHRPTGLVVVAGWVAQPPTTRKYLVSRFLRALYTHYVNRAEHEDS